jgi:pyrimidine and pyridine-specific 5'-nucleotidase
MTELIDQYFIKHLELTRDDAYKLHQEYYKSYGLAIEGLVRHHKIEPLEYNRQVDDAIPLESIIFPDADLRKLLLDIDKSKVKLWLFTNAYVTHGQRVVRLLGVDDLFEGLTFCDYAQETMICKPHPEMFAKAMKEAGIKEFKDCYFVGKRSFEGLGMRTNRHRRFSSKL